LAESQLEEKWEEEEERAMNGSVKVAAAQLAPVFLDRDATVEKACTAIREAGRNGASLIVFPEAFVPGYPYWAIVRDPTETPPFQRRLHEQAVEIPGPVTDALCDAAREAGCWVCMGVNEKEGGTLYAAIVYIGPDGRIAGRHRKLVPTNHERMVWGRGDGRDLCVFETPFGVLGGLLCYEHGNALFRYAIQAQREAVHVAMWPGGMPSITGIIDAAVRHYAFEGACFVVNATSILTEEIIRALGEGGNVAKLSPGGGYSAILGPRGQFFAGPADHGEETVLYADLDPAALVDAKTVFDCCGHYARPDVVTLHVRRGAQNPVEMVD
jgi:aliphatic nitrilase